MSRAGPASWGGVLEGPDAALARLCERVNPVETEIVEAVAAAGRVLAETVMLDRPSPACDVSAMDGYAVGVADIPAGRRLQVCGEVQAGAMATPLAPGTAMRVFTGAMIPESADAVIPREQLIEHGDQVCLPAELRVVAGQHIRRRGENGLPGRELATPGGVITGPVLAAAASCGKRMLRVYRRLRLGIIVTGGEVLAGGAKPQPWQVRDCNGPALLGMLASAAWLDPRPAIHVQDESAAIADAVTKSLADCDALLITGGVSAGDYDFVPAVLRDLGCSTVFHKLAIRPGRPVLGAVDSAGRPILALPGNPVSVMVTARRLAAAALRRRGGLSQTEPAEMVEVDDAAAAPAQLTWFPLVGRSGPGRVSLVAGMSSGDWISAAASDGFIQVPPGESARGFRRFYRWTLAD